MAEKSTSDGDKAAPVTIKKYANRRLYNTVTSSYVTLDDLAKMVREGIDFVVYDAKSGDDITRSVLTQIIVEEENKGQNLLPISFLRQLIGFYGDSLQGLVPQYLDLTMQSFARNQEQIRKYIQDSFGGMFPFGRFDEMSRQNMAILEQAMKMFTPFPTEAGNASGAGKATDEAPREHAEETLDKLRAQLERMQAQIDALADNDKQ